MTSKILCCCGRYTESTKGSEEAWDQSGFGFVLYFLDERIVAVMGHWSRKFAFQMCSHILDTFEYSLYDPLAYSLYDPLVHGSHLCY